MKKKKKILLVDDNSINLSFLSRCINRPEFEITATENSMRALSLLKREEFDAVITDYLMPGLNGLDILKFLVKSGVKTKKVLVTGVNDIGVLKSVVNENLADLFLEKPFKKNDLFNLIRKINNDTMYHKWLAETKNLRSGLVVNNDVRDSKSRLVLSAGTKLNNKLIQSLRLFESRQHECFKINVSEKIKEIA